MWLCHLCHLINGFQYFQGVYTFVINRKVVRNFWDFGVEKVPKFANFWANIVEFRVEKGHFLVVPQCYNGISLVNQH